HVLIGSARPEIIEIQFQRGDAWAQRPHVALLTHNHIVHLIAINGNARREFCVFKIWHTFPVRAGQRSRFALKPGELTRVHSEIDLQNPFRIVKLRVTSNTDRLGRRLKIPWIGHSGTATTAPAHQQSHCAGEQPVDRPGIPRISCRCYCHPVTPQMLSDTPGLTQAEGKYHEARPVMYVRRSYTHNRNTVSVSGNAPAWRNDFPPGRSVQKKPRGLVS